MNNKILSLMGLCRRAGRMTIGNDSVIDSINRRTARLVIIADDVSERTKKGIVRAAAENNVKVISINENKDEISDAVGKFCAVLSIEDSGFAKKLIQLADIQMAREEIE